MLKYQIITFGCQMNYSDSERVAAILEKSGYLPSTTVEDVDLMIFNTCSIRQKGEDRVHGMLKNANALKKGNPRLLIGVTGCMIRQTSSRNSPWKKKDHLLKLVKSLDFVFRINDTHILPQVLVEAEPALDLPDLPESELNDYLQVKPAYSSPFQAFVPIQIGCDKYCTYCIVPYSRGREKSRPQTDILAECRQLVENGCREINLVGQTVNSYGLSQLDKLSGHFDWYHQPEGVDTPHPPQDPLPPPFIKLLQELDQLAELGLSRLRYSSSHPRDFGPELIQAHVTLKTLCPHLHLPVQSGDDQILARMNRKYSYADFRDKIQAFRAALPGAAVTTDIIIGFPGETDQQFENTVRAFEELRFDQAYLARYSERSGTVAAKCFPDDVPQTVKATRWHRLNNRLREISLDKNTEYIGHTLEVLVERFDQASGEAEGRSRENKLVQFPGSPALIGRLIMVKITDSRAWLLKGQLQGYAE